MVTDNDACSNCGFPNSSTVRRPQSHANSTVVSSYLRNNLPPSEFEASNIREALADAVGGLVALDGRIEGIEAVLLRLKTERGNLEKVVTDHQAVMSPIRRLSTELVSEIFLYACNSPVTLDTRTGPWPIAQVCDRWRSIAVSTSKLWSSIHINVANQRIPPLSLSILHAIMCRTGNSLLDVAFDVSNPLPVLVSKAGPLLEILAAVSHRWRSIRFTSVQAYIGYLDQIAGHLPSLEEVMITVFDSPLGGGKREFTMFSGAPKLRRLHLGKARGLRIAFPWSQLVYLDPGATGSNQMQFLQRANNITELHLHGSDKKCPEITGTNFIRLEHLRKLELTEGSKVLHHFAFPALDSLHFKGAFSSAVMADLSMLFDRAPYPLTQLKLTLDQNTEDVPLLLFQQLSPSLVNFDLTLAKNIHGTSDMALGLLLLDQVHKAFIFPRLATLSIDISTSKVQLNTDFIVDAIKLRTSPPGNPRPDACLRELQFRFHPTADPLTLATIDNLRLLYPNP